MPRQTPAEALKSESEREKLLTSLEQLTQVLEVMGKLVVRLKDQAESLPNANTRIDQKLDRRIALSESTAEAEKDGKKPIVIH